MQDLRGVRSRYEDVDLVIVRENTEDLYAGIEYEAGSDAAEHVIETLNGLQPKQIVAGSGISVKPISAAASGRSSASRSSTRARTDAVRSPA